MATNAHSATASGRTLVHPRWGVGPLIGVAGLLWAGLMLLLDRLGGQALSVPPKARPVFTIIGLALLIVGVPIHATVALYFRRHRDRGQRLVTTGPYALVRHPLYAVWMFILVPGLVFLGRSWLLLTVPLAMYAAARALLRHEDGRLLATFGETYASYMDRTGALFPRGASLCRFQVPSAMSGRPVDGQGSPAGHGAAGERRGAAGSHSLFDFGPLAHEYDRWYETPTGQAHDRVQKQDVERLLPVARAGERLLDLGCGTGHWSSFFAARGYRVQGIDISPEMVTAAKASVPEAEFRVADAYALPFADASFDVVAAMAALEFVPDAAAVVSEMARCTKPGGSMLVGTLNRLAPLNQDRVSMGKPPYASAHLFSPGELRRLLAPWGSVRMAASPVPESTAGSPLSRNIVDRVPALEGTLRGPLIVAEVRR